MLCGRFDLCIQAEPMIGTYQGQPIGRIHNYENFSSLISHEHNIMIQ